MLPVNRENKYTNYIVPGGYIAQIKTVKHDTQKKILRVAFDICEGEYAGCFKKEYDANISKGWPRKAAQEFKYGEDLGEKLLNAFIDNLEASNRFTFTGDENAFKGLKIGVYYQKHYWTPEGTTEKKLTASFPKFTSIKKIQKGEFSIEEKASSKPKNQNNNSDDDSFSNFDFGVKDDDIQF